MCGWVEVVPSKRRMQLLALGAMKLKIPRLENKKVKVRGMIPRLSKARALLPKN